MKVCPAKVGIGEKVRDHVVKVGKQFITELRVTVTLIYTRFVGMENKRIKR